MAEVESPTRQCNKCKGIFYEFLFDHGVAHCLNPECNSVHKVIICPKCQFVQFDRELLQ